MQNFNYILNVRRLEQQIQNTKIIPTLLYLNMLNLIGSKLVYWSSFRKFANTLLSIQNTSQNLLKKDQLNAHFANSNQSDQQSIINIMNFIRDKPKTGLANKVLVNLLINRYFNDVQDKSALGNDIDGIIDLLKDSQQQQGQEGTVKLQDVCDLLEVLQQLQGKGSLKTKIEIIEETMDDMNALQIRMLFRIINKKLRIGLADKSIQFNKSKITNPQNQEQKPISSDGKQKQLSSALQKPTKKAKKQIIYDSLSKQPSAHFMVAGRLGDIEDLWKFCQSKGQQKLYADLKYDGERTLIVYKKNTPIQLISRNKKSQLQNYKPLTTLLYQQLQKIPEIESIQIDGQMMCITHEGKHLTSYQLTKKRGKQVIENQISKVVIFAFDVLEYNGTNLIKQPLKNRKKFIPTTQHIKLCQSFQFTYPQDKQLLLTKFQQVLEQNGEGLIIKGENDQYCLNGSRKHWCKLKRGIKLSKIDTGQIDLDLVVMGVQYGEGKRGNVIGSFLVGAYDDGKLYPVCKVGTGFSEQQLIDFTKMFKEIIVENPPPQYEIPKTIKAKYVQPKYVFKVTAMQLSRSPLYKLGYQQGKGGISLRHPKFECLREDKDPQSCDSSQLVGYIVSDGKV